MKRTTKKKPGFTFVELLFAIVVMGTMFSLALVVFTRMLSFYVFAGSVRQNQENSRNLLDSISREIRFGQLLTPSDTAPTQAEICIYSPESKKTLLYKFESNQINKYESKITFETYKAALDNIGVGTATACNPSPDTNISIKSSLLASSSVKVVGFNVIRTQGAKSQAFTTAKAVTINLKSITKSSTNPPLVGGVDCANNDIYCNSLILNTAINIKGGN